ncbi:hypothetical protein RR46_00876 [Papilio xuthus]|uniref:Uncharacterized protein n=1 Tax=Papilio xuthus TaxID=66420 RepID=A0A0N1PFP9_PAPXU|nr:hypothetical protein RR46_00876 [Papilio xuthus]
MLWMRILRVTRRSFGADYIDSENWEAKIKDTLLVRQSGARKLVEIAPRPACKSCRREREQTYSVGGGCAQTDAAEARPPALAADLTPADSRQPTADGAPDINTHPSPSDKGKQLVIVMESARADSGPEATAPVDCAEPEEPYGRGAPAYRGAADWRSGVFAR